MTEAFVAGPLHYPVDVRVLPRGGYDETIRASETERAALARANGIAAVGSFEAELRVLPWRADGVRVTGRLRATVEQSCVVTLEPVRALIDEALDATFVPTGSPLARGEADGEIVIDADGDDAPEPFDPPTLDLGAVASEFLTLALDPYPRAPGAELPREARDEAASPFAALGVLKAGRS